MQARLTFSTVTTADPDLLIVDEALSVGDARFQLKSFGRFEEFRRRGKSIILVSHNLNTITGFCDRAILLEGGRVLLDGSPLEVSTFYNRLVFGEDGEIARSLQRTAAAVDVENDRAPTAAKAPRGSLEASNVQDGFADPNGIDDAGRPENPGDSREYRFGTKVAEIYDFGILGPHGRRSTLLVSGEKYRCFMRVVTHCPIENSCAGFVVRSIRGVDLFGTDTTCIEGFPNLPLARAGDRVEVSIDIRAWLGPGDYFMTFALADRSGLKLDCRLDALHFTVIGPPTIHTISIVNLNPSYHMRSLSHRTAGAAAPDDALVAALPVIKA
jgi:lipopolysaccharide transport system ATP-binding protein